MRRSGTKKGVLTMISYNPLWKKLIDLNKKKMDLLELADISRGTLAKMSKNETVNLAVIDRLCKKLDCGISDIIEYVPEDTTD
jgi:DNA-binding Xre family transcriptional regulator